MKKILLLTAVAFLFVGSLSAQQKTGYLYSKKVFDAIPAYKSAETQIKNYVDTGTKEYQDRLQKVQEMYTEYNKYQSQMSTTQRDRYKQMIVDEEEKANKYEEEYFGKGGVIEKQQELLLKPIEEQVQQAVAVVAEKGGYGMVFDLSLVKVSVYQAPSLDLTDLIIKQLGY